MKTTVKGNKITIEFELGEGTLSGSGKSMVLCSTRGNKSIAGLSASPDAKKLDDVMVGLNVYRSV